MMPAAMRIAGGIRIGGAAVAAWILIGLAIY